MQDDEWQQLNEELVSFAQRYAKARDMDADDVLRMEALAWNEPGESAGWMLCGHAVGTWTVTQDELERLWLIGRAAGYTREELLPDSTLAKALPGRAQRPADPPGDFVQTPLLPGGGHGPGREGAGKRTFPVRWSDDDSIRHTMDVARRPSGAVELPSGDFRAYGERDGVAMGVLVSPAGAVLTSYPVAGDGVVQNPLGAEQQPHVDRLQALVDRLVPASEDEPRASLDELMAVGEWSHVVASLRALAPDEQQTHDLAELARLAGPET